MHRWDPLLLLFMKPNGVILSRLTGARLGLDVLSLSEATANDRLSAAIRISAATLPKVNLAALFSNKHRGANSGINFTN